MQKTTTGIITNMKYQQGDIILIPFPFNDNFSLSKKRPCLIISKNEINTHACIVAKITSVIKNDYLSYPIFKIDVSGFDMLKASEVRTNEIMTIHETLIINKIGSIKKESLEKVLLMVKDHISM